MNNVEKLKVNAEKLKEFIKKETNGGTIKDWIKKHNDTLLSAGTILAGILTTLSSIAIASELSGSRMRGMRNRPLPPQQPDPPIPFVPFSGPSFTIPRAGRAGGGKCCSCQCGRNCDQIMEQLGGYQVAQNYLIKYPKVGSGLIDDLIHKGITKGFNFVGNVGLNILIEAIIKIVGEGFRKDINRLVKKYGWKSIAIIKKYALFF